VLQFDRDRTGADGIILRRPGSPADQRTDRGRPWPVPWPPPWPPPWPAAPEPGRARVADLSQPAPLAVPASLLRYGHAARRARHRTHVPAHLHRPAVPGLRVHLWLDRGCG